VLGMVEYFEVRTAFEKQRKANVFGGEGGWTTHHPPSRGGGGGCVRDPNNQ